MSDLDSSWHTDAFPELRSGPPWVMEEMIALEPSLPAAIKASRDAAEEIASVLLATVEEDLQPIVCTGCGTSEHAAMAVAALIEDSLRGAAGPEWGMVQARQAFELALDPPGGGTCLGITHDGSTAATIAALEASRAAGAGTVVITARPDAVARVADHLLATPLIDRSWCHTVAYTSAILAGALIADCVTERSSVNDHLAAFMDGVRVLDGFAAVGRALDGVRVLVTCGSGLDRVAARELALKVEEGARLASVAYELETVLHGHLAGYDARDAMVVIATDPKAFEQRIARARQVLRAAGRIGLRVAGIFSESAAAELDEDLTPAGRMVLPQYPEGSDMVGALVGSALSLQMLTVALAHNAGVNPDLIRREESNYREAAAAADQ